MFVGAGSIAAPPFWRGRSRLSLSRPAHATIGSILSGPGDNTVGVAFGVTICAAGATAYVIVPPEHQVLVVDVATPLSAVIRFPDEYP